MRVVRERPDVPIIGLTPSLETARQLALAWGVTPVNIGLTHTMTETVSQATQIAKREGLAQKGDQIVVVAGVPFGKAGSTNSLRVAIVGDKSRPAKAPPEDS